MRFILFMILSGLLFGCSPRQSEETAPSGLIKDTGVPVTIQAQDDGLWQGFSNKIAGLQRLSTEKVDNPGDMLKRLMEDSGLAPKFNVEGTLTALTLP